MARGVTITRPPRPQAQAGQHLEQRQRPKRRLKRGPRVRNLGQIGYAKTRQLAAAAGLETEGNTGRLVTSLYRYVLYKAM